ncbi:hypothetical protein, partial [Burkholderia ubonensis]|uniref:hypothetical protein n=1 Tax=Burkholderia ubonensis TaxID=101571 RepID=UPI0018DEDFFB
MKRRRDGGARGTKPRAHCCARGAHQAPDAAAAEAALSFLPFFFEPFVAFADDASAGALASAAGADAPAAAAALSFFDARLVLAGFDAASGALAAGAGAVVVAAPVV